jgi:Chaperone for flagella basal body P-ring formation
MSGNYFVRQLSLLVALVGLGGVAMASTYLNTPCVNLAEIAAAEPLRSSGLSPLAARSGSYRVSEVLWDPVLGRRWAMVASCEHPEQPAFAVPTKEAIGERQSGRRKDDSVPVVRAGEVVRLWWQEDNLRIEMTAMSEENGSLGKVIRVRLMGGDSAERQFVGIVRGIADVEMRR